MSAIIPPARCSLQPHVLFSASQAPQLMMTSYVIFDGSRAKALPVALQRRLPGFPLAKSWNDNFVASLRWAIILHFP